jgi:hypothetical protein
VNGGFSRGFAEAGGGTVHAAGDAWLAEQGPLSRCSYCPAADGFARLGDRQWDSRPVTPSQYQLYFSST